MSKNSNKIDAASLTLRKYTSEVEYSEEDLHWLQKAPSAKRIIDFRSNVEGAVNALNANINEDTAKMFYLGQGTTFFTGGDSLPSFDQAHLIRKSGTTAHPNLFYTGFGASTTHLAFSPDALVEAVQRMDRFLLNDASQMNKTKRLRVICSTELGEIVARTLTSMYGPDTSYLGVNKAASSFQKGMLGRSIDFRVMPYIPYAYRNYWFLVDLDRANKMLWLAWGWKPRLGDQPDKRKGLFYNEGSTLFGPVASDWRFGFASKGDGTTVA